VGEISASTVGARRRVVLRTWLQEDLLAGVRVVLGISLAQLNLGVFASRFLDQTLPPLAGHFSLMAPKEK
jgi:hypothetical protein